jgi:hypothetical protein
MITGVLLAIRSFTILKKDFASLVSMIYGFYNRDKSFVFPLSLI